MDLNYDCFDLIKRQCNVKIFLLFTCRDYRNLIKEGKRYRAGKLINDNWAGYGNSDNYIISLAANLTEDRYGIRINIIKWIDTISEVYFYNNISIHHIFVQI